MLFTVKYCENAGNSKLFFVQELRPMGKREKQNQRKA
jgi:hypothetical protein